MDTTPNAPTIDSHTDDIRPTLDLVDGDLQEDVQPASELNYRIQRREDFGDIRPNISCRLER